VVYTDAQVRTLTPFRETVEKRASLPDLRDVVLCHAWDDRSGAAKELYDLLNSRGVTVWFSEKDVALGTPLLREIDRGLARSRVGIVLVTPALLKRLAGEGIVFTLVAIGILAFGLFSLVLARYRIIPDLGAEGRVPSFRA